MIRGLLGSACLVAHLCASPSAEIVGTVVDSLTGKPIAQARVTVTVYESVRPRNDEVFVVLTGDDGRFRLLGLPDSRCGVEVEKPGYGKDQSNCVIGRDLDFYAPLKFRLAPTGAVTVRVIDPSGAAIDGAQVSVVRKSESNLPGAMNLGIAYATPEGLRRLLPVGEYRVVAVSPGTGNLLRARGQTFVPTYYPGTTEASRAQWIEIVAGKEIQVAVPVIPIRAHAIRGRLGFSATLVQMMVLPVGSNDYHVNWALPHVDRNSGEFRITGLAPGAYVIDASVCVPPDCMRGGSFRKTVQIVDGDLENVIITEADRTPGR